MPDCRRADLDFDLVICTVGHWNDGTLNEEYLFWDNQSSMSPIGLGK
jgi:hypothetical protein